MVIERNKFPGEVIAEAAQGYRNAVERGDITVTEALEKTNKAMRDLQILAVLGIPFETGSTQVGQLTEVNRRLCGAEVFPSVSDN